MSISISALPNEILLKIMWILIWSVHSKRRYRVYSDWSRFMGRPRDEWGFLTVTQVCSHWRRLATSTPTLWSFFDLVDKHGTLLCLERCPPPTPLRITSKEPCAEAFQAIRNKLVVERLESTCIWTNDIVGMADILSIISSSASLPYLKYLELIAQFPSMNPPSARDPHALRIQIAGSQAPNLESLTLANIYFKTLSPHSFCGLRTLDLRYSMRQYYDIDLEQFLAAFGPQNRLQALSILAVNLTGSPALGLWDAHLDGYFPELTGLALTKCLNTESFIACIGPCAKVENAYFYCQEAPNLYEAVPSNLLTKLPFSLRNLPVKLQVVFDGPMGAVDIRCKDLSSPCCLDLAVGIIPESISHHQTLVHAAQIFEQLHVRHLCIPFCHGSWQDMEPAFTTLFSTFPNIEILDLSVDAICALRVLGTGDGDAITPFLCPKLREIRVDVAQNDTLTALLACVEKRVSQFSDATRLEKLVINHTEDCSNLLEEFLGSLRTAVATVECHKVNPQLQLFTILGA